MFEFRADPDNRQDVPAAVWYPLPFGSDQANASPRLAETARLAGVDIYAFIRPGAHLEVPDPTLRREISHGNFERHNDAVLRQLGRVAANYDHVVGMGDSAGGITVNALAVDPRQPFTHLLWRDSIMMRQLPPGIAQLGYFAYQAWESAMRPDNDVPIPPIEGLPELSTSRKLRRSAMEIYHFGSLWRGTLGQELALQVAGSQPELPILHVAVGHTFTGTFEDCTEFHRAVRSARDHAASDPAPIVFDHKPDWWHGHLLTPSGAAEDIEVALSLSASEDADEA